MKTVLARRFVSLVLAGGLVLGAAMTAAAQVEVDAGLSQYERTSGVSGNLNSIGSDTLNNLMTLWAEAFRAVYPNVNIQIEGKGSSTAPPALIEGTAQLGPMSRPMKSSELDRFEQNFRLQADAGEGRHRRPGGVRAQGQPGKRSDPEAG